MKDELDRFAISNEMRQQYFKLGWTGTAALLLVFILLYVDCVSSRRAETRRDANEWKEMYKEVVRQQVQPAKQELLQKQEEVTRAADSIRRQVDSLNYKR